MPQLAVAAVGAYIGSAAITGTVLGLSGATIGWGVGSILGAALFAPDGPGAQLQDTRAAKLQYGAKIPRIAGRHRLPLSLRWMPDEWRKEERETGGKDGGGGSEYFTYSTDGLFWVADATPDIKPIAMTRLWHNGKLVWSAMADSDAASLKASDEQSLFAEVLFHDGNPAQLPWPVYEAAVGTANADAHRRITCVSIEGYQAGTSPNWGLFEGEFITNGTQVGSDALTVLQMQRASDGSDISAYNNGAPTIVGTDITVNAAGVSVDKSDSNQCYAEWTVASIGGYSGPLIIEGYITVTEAINSFVPFLWYYPDTGATNIYHRLDLVYAAGVLKIYYEDAAFGIIEPPIEIEFDQRVHFLISMGGGYSFVAAINGVAFVSNAGSPPAATTSGTGTVRLGSIGGSAGQKTWVIDSVRLRRENVYGPWPSAYPAELPPPDGSMVKWTPLPEDLKDVCDSEMARCRRVGGWYDNAELAGIDVTGIAFNASARNSLEQLAATYYFGAVCRDQLITRLRGSASVDTIANASTGAALGSPGDPFAGVDVPDDLEVPAFWSVTSPDVDADYDAGTETSERLITNGVEVRQVQLLAVLTAAERKGRANAMAMDAWVGAHTAALALSDQYAKLEPCDVITPADDEGNTYRLRIDRETYAQGVKDLLLVLDDASALPTSGITAAPFEPTVTVAGAGKVDGILLDGPIARDADDDHGLYWVTDLSDGADAASLFRSTDDVTFAQVLTTTGDAITGTAGTKLGNWTGGYLRDDINTVRVTVTGTLAAATDDQVLQDESVNAFALGTHGRWEYGQFLSPTLVSSNADGTTTYDITRMLRGRRGSEAHMGTHAAGDTFILLRLAGLRRYAMDSGEAGLTRHYKHVPAGVRSSTVTSEAFINNAVGRKPYAGVHAEVARDGSDNATITWSRRSRLSCGFVGASGISCPLGEASESYEVDIYADGTYATVLRTISATSASAAYSSADQTADGLTPGDPLFFRIYQLSETVGRGYALEATA